MKVSYSQIACYKNCRRMWELKYKNRLYPAVKPEPLETGSSYHKKVEKILDTGDFEPDGNLKTNAMAEAFKKYIAPTLNVEDVEVKITLPFGDDIIDGRIDAITTDGIPIEHKTTSAKIDGEYWFELENNEQIIMYMYLMETNRIIYTACQKPTIKLRKGETEEEFQQRLIDWYDETKIGSQLIIKSWDEINAYADQLSCIIDEMRNCKLMFKNPSVCHLYYRACEYMPICHTYKAEDEIPIGFTKGEEK